MCGYSDFSLVYDILTDDVDYKGRTEYLYGLFKRFGEAPSLLLDLACGTGSFSCEFAKKGIEVIAVEPSQEMLACAKEKAAEENLDILFLCQSAQELELYGTVDGAVCCLDSLNHITDAEQLQHALSRVSLFLEPGKLFIFDVNTEHKHKNILGNETFVIEKDNIFCVWQNEYEDTEKITYMSLDFFIEENGVYNRFCEDFSERAYSSEELSRMLENAGLKIEAVFDDMSENEPKNDSQRVVYVTRKV